MTTTSGLVTAMRLSDAITADGPAGAAAVAGPIADPTLRDYVQLLKPRVMSLVVFTAFVGLIAAPSTPHPLLAFAALLCIAAGAGAAGALNMWYDADIDRLMARTRGRPIPSGRVAAEDALGLGVGLAVLSVALLATIANPLAAALLALTIGFYLFVYTMWLKRRTSQNIVVGGVAGALPPVIGWAAATGSTPLEAWLLFAIVFLWTPPHSWALALFRDADYGAVGVPMLPSAAGGAAARRQAWLYSLALAPAALAPAAVGPVGFVYAAVVTVMTAEFLRRAWAIRTRDDATARADRFIVEKKFFGYSIVYLFVVFAAVLLDLAAAAAWRAWA